VKTATSSAKSIWFGLTDDVAGSSPLGPVLGTVTTAFFQLTFELKEFLISVDILFRTFDPE